jgi:hypothetical protein
MNRNDDESSVAPASHDDQFGTACTSYHNFSEFEQCLDHQGRYCQVGGNIGVEGGAKSVRFDYALHKSHDIPA